MTDILERLAGACYCRDVEQGGDSCTPCNAIDEIERLREKVASYEVVRVQLTERGDKYLRELAEARAELSAWKDAAIKTSVELGKATIAAADQPSGGSDGR